jgi:coenzyme PQQ precursor peptide PqqA
MRFQRAMDRLGGLTKILRFSRPRLTPLAPNKPMLFILKSAPDSAPWNWERNMTWTAPEACEICCGMEVTSYMSAEI